MSFLYMKTTNDELELPVAVADSGAELARMLGISATSLWSMISRGKCGYHKVEIEDGENDNN